MNRRTLILKIQSASFCDNGAMIPFADIAGALDADRGSGFVDPTHAEVLLLVQGSENHGGAPPPDLCARHPALDALLTREMT